MHLVLTHVHLKFAMQKKKHRQNDKMKTEKRQWILLFMKMMMRSIRVAMESHCVRFYKYDDVVDDIKLEICTNTRRSFVFMFPLSSHWNSETMGDTRHTTCEKCETKRRQLAYNTIKRWRQHNNFDISIKNLPVDEHTHTHTQHIQKLSLCIEKRHSEKLYFHMCAWRAYECEWLSKWREFILLCAHSKRLKWNRIDKTSASTDEARHIHAMENSANVNFTLSF